MGCKESKNTFDTVEDSLNMMIHQDNKEAKKDGKPLTGFVPRAEHPLLQNNGKNEISGSNQSLR